MATDKKIIDRINRLIALGSDKRNDNKHERENATKEAIRLMQEHDVSIGGHTEQKTRTVVREVVREVYVAPRPEEKIISGSGGTCAYCKKPYRRGDDVWLFPDGRVIHGEWPAACGENFDKRR